MDSFQYEIVIFLGSYSFRCIPFYKLLDKFLERVELIINNSKDEDDSSSHSERMCIFKE